MAETAKQYVGRILAYIGKQKPVSVLKSTPARLERVLRGVPAKKLRRRPAPGKWSIAEIVLHLADSEMILGYRYRTILAKNRARIVAVNQDDWAASGLYQRRDLRAALEMFRAVRRANLELLGAIPRKQWSNYGLHSERGKESLAHIVQLYAGHDLNHLLQIQRILKG
ncbi:MAG: DinB family protein [Candidatus Acidiferrales bacterium]